jgi:hypothetical protein
MYRFKFMGDFQMRAPQLLVLILMGVAGVVSAAAATPYTIATFDPPGSINTTPISINTTGQITGGYEGTPFAEHGFLYNAGAITTFDPPGSILTNALSINAAGQITGYYFDGTRFHGFLDSAGTITKFDVSGADETLPASINDVGQITGFYSKGSVAHGFLATPQEVPEPTSLALLTTGLFGLVLTLIASRRTQPSTMRLCLKRLSTRPPIEDQRKGVSACNWDAQYWWLKLGQARRCCATMRRRPEELGYAHPVAPGHVLGANPATDHGDRRVGTTASTYHHPFVLFGFLSGCTRRIGFAVGC